MDLPPFLQPKLQQWRLKANLQDESIAQVVDDPNVLKSEIDDIRKSVVSMSVGQPARTSTIVKEWLEQPAP